MTRSLATIFQLTRERTLFQVTTPKTRRQRTDLNKIQTKFKQPVAISSSKLSLQINHRLNHKIKWLRPIRMPNPLRLRQTQTL